MTSTTTHFAHPRAHLRLAFARLSAACLLTSFASVGLGGCSPGSPDGAQAQLKCANHSECTGDDLCVAGVCVAADQALESTRASAGEGGIAETGELAEAGARAGATAAYQAHLRARRAGEDADMAYAPVVDCLFDQAAVPAAEARAARAGVSPDDAVTEILMADVVALEDDAVTLALRGRIRAPQGGLTAYEEIVRLRRVDGEWLVTDEVNGGHHACFDEWDSLTAPAPDETAPTP